jgi:hypothetical protein
MKRYSARTITRLTALGEPVKIPDILIERLRSIDLMLAVEGGVFYQ